MRPWMLLVATGFCFSLTTLSSKMCGKRLPASEKLWIRALACMPLIIGNKASLLREMGNSNNKLYLVLRGSIGCVSSPIVLSH